MSGASAVPRYHAFDVLRASMMMLGVVLHTACSYATSLGRAWAYQDISRSVFFDLLVVIIHVFRMPVFFVMAGFFAAMTYRRHGALGFAKHRALRVGLPFAVAVVVMWPLVTGGFRFALRVKDPATWEKWRSFEAPFAGMHTGYLWFLYYLLWYYAIALLVGWLLARGPESARRTLESTLRATVRSPLLRLVFLVGTACTLYIMPGGLLQMSSSFTPSLVVLAAYGLFFFYGWSLFLDGEEAVTSLQRHAVKQLLAGFLLTLPLIALSIKAMKRLPESDLPTHVSVVALGAACMWLFIFGMSGVCLRFFNTERRWVRYIADAAYWVYLVHLPIIAWQVGALATWPVNAFVKFSIILCSTTALSLATYHLFVQGTALGVVLGSRAQAEKLVPASS